MMVAEDRVSPRWYLEYLQGSVFLAWLQYKGVGRICTTLSDLHSLSRQPHAAQFYCSLHDSFESCHVPTSQTLVRKAQILDYVTILRLKAGITGVSRNRKSDTTQNENSAQTCSPYMDLGIRWKRYDVSLLAIRPTRRGIDRDSASVSANRVPRPFGLVARNAERPFSLIAYPSFSHAARG